MADGKTCKHCGGALVQMEGCDIWECQTCHATYAIAPKRPRGYWTAGGEDWWTDEEAQNGMTPSDAYWVDAPDKEAR